MKNTRQERTWSRRITVLLAVLTAAVLLALPAAAATVTASDVMIRNSGEEKDNNIIGVLNEGDKVTVKSKTTDSNGTEWYYVELPNGNTGYVKAQWIDNGGEEVETVQQPAQEDQTGEDQEEPAAQEPAGEDDSDGADDWTEEDAEMLAGTPSAGEDAATEGTESSQDGVAQSQDAPEVDNGQSYDPYTDPNAQYSINFVTESDGTGSWYIYNYDTDKRIRIGDLEKLSDAQNAAQKSAARAGIWRAIACILLILLAALLIFLYIFLKRNGFVRPAPARRRDTRRRARALEDDEEEDEWSPEEDADEEEPELSRGGASEKQESLEKEDPEEDYSEEDSDEEQETDSGDDDYEEEDGYEDEDDEYEEDEDDYDRPGPRRGGFLGFLKNIFSAGDVDDEYDDDEYDDEEEGEEDVYEEDEIDEVYDSDPEEDAEYDEEEDDADLEEEKPRPTRRSPSGSSGSSRKPAPRPRKRPARTIEFDEESDYPEDAELLSFVKSRAASVEKEQRAAEAVQSQEAKTVELPKPAPDLTETGKKPASAQTGKGKPSNTVPTAPGPDEDMEFFADDDDDMEYSFLAGPSRRSRS